MPRLLVVEDDELTGTSVQEALERQSMDSDLVETVEDAEQLMVSASYDVVILDWELPGTDGPTWCAKLRGSGNMIPILMLTGKKRLAEKERGFSCGADDYLVKPFELPELVMRVKALLRRVPMRPTSRWSCGDVTVDLEARTAFASGVTIELMPLEHKLLEFFIRHSDRALSTEEIICSVWGPETEASIASLRQTINRLRRKFNWSDEEPIRAVRGVGYIFEPRNGN